MSIESEAYAALKGLVPKAAPYASQGKVYADLNDDAAAPPYIVFNRAGGPAPIFMENASPSKDMARLQVTSWHTSRVAAQALGEQVLAALVALGWRPVGGAVALHDQQTKYRGHAQDFQAFADR